MPSPRNTSQILRCTAMRLTIYATAIFSVYAGPEQLISIDTFLQLSNFFFDNKHSFDPNLVTRGDIVFVGGGGNVITAPCVTKFFKKIHPHIKVPYILITWEGCWLAPGAFAQHLNDPKLYAWFTKNRGSSLSDKLIGIPIGIESQSRGNDSVTLTWLAHQKKIPPNERNNLVCTAYLKLGTSRKARQDMLEILERQIKFTMEPPCKRQPYLDALLYSKFIPSPRGNGLDCHRTWEALYTGCIPILKTSSLDFLYADLPVLIVNDWNLVTPEFLARSYNAMQTKTYNRAKLYAEYWQTMIRSYQQRCKNGG